jgi:spermidine/putrescine transport system ATP-binding protein
MSDRIAVMRDGVFEQIGSAAEIYDKPATDYVARFVGNANVLYGYAPSGIPARGAAIAVRRENIILTPDGAAAGGYISAVVTDKTFSGGLLRVTADMDVGAEVTASRHGIDSDLYAGQRVKVAWAPQNAAVVKITGGMADAGGPRSPQQAVAGPHKGAAG